MSYQDDLYYLYSLQKFGIKLGLSNIRDLCSLLNNPQDKIRTIHVAGTNGKGSTAAIISSILQEAGYRVGLYTSPHLVSFTERIRVNNITVSEERVSRLTAYIRTRISGTDIVPTFFEFTTALALAYFAEEEVDIAVMETGMGGRLDATNIISPLISIITNVDYDHTQHLGLSLKEIAAEKCGIIKAHVPVVTSEVKEEVLAVIRKCALDAGAPVSLVGKDFHAEPVRLEHDYSEYYYHGLRWEKLFLCTHLAGRHQMFNIGAALCAIELLTERGFYVTLKQVAEGVRNVSWPGRLEVLSDKPLLLLDGAHNHAGIMALREFIEDVLRRDKAYKRIIVIFGVLKDKDVGSMIAELAACASEVIITRPDTERGLTTGELRNIAEGHGITPRVTRTVSEALSLANGIATPSDAVIVTGSLYVVGEARALISNRLVSG